MVPSHGARLTAPYNTEAAVAHVSPFMNTSARSHIRIGKISEGLITKKIMVLPPRYIIKNKKQY